MIEREKRRCTEGKRAYKKDINGFLPTHVRLLDLFDLQDKPVQPLRNLLP